MCPFLRRIVLVALLAAAAACDRGETDSAAAGDLSPADRARLEALGYEPWVAESAAPAELGVVVHDRSRTDDGFVLFANRGDCSAVLIDRDGRVLHRWEAPRPARGYWSDTRLLRDGTLVVAGAGSFSSAHQQRDRYVRGLAWDSSVVWDAGFPGHHDIELLPDGNLLMLSSEVRRIDLDGRPLTILDDEIVLTDPSGRRLQTHSLHDAFRATPGLVLQRVNRRQINVGGTQGTDLFHTNSVDRVDLPALAGSHPVYTAGNILFSSRHQDLVAVLDPGAGHLVWQWGPGIIEGQHSARWLANGNVLLFDNGLVRRWSRVLEVDPRTDTIVWEYPGERDHRFFTAGGGAAQRLPGGNTLVTVTAQGELFEVTPAGEVVWRFVNPTGDPQKKRRATIHASTWMPPGFVLPVLARRR